jgi:hypothetical protein
VFVAHPYLEGVDGIALDRAGNIWGAANERNTIVVVASRTRVVEFFLNQPDEQTQLRNEGPPGVPDEPVFERTQAVHHALGRQSARQLPEQRGDR